FTPTRTHRGRRYADPAAGSGSRTLGSVIDPARTGITGARGTTRRCQWQLRAAGRDRRLPCARVACARYRLGADRVAVRAPCRGCAVADSGIESRGRGVDGRRPGGGLQLVDALQKERALAGYHLLPSVRGDLLFKLGRHNEARAEFERAASLTGNTRESELLRQRADACVDQ